MLSSFLEGIFAYTQAARYLTKKGLWGYAVLPGIISLLLGASIGYAAWSGADNIGTWLIAWYPLEWGAAALAKISVWLGGAVLFLVGLMLYKHLVMIIVSPLMTPLSQKIEQQLLGQIETDNGFQLSKAIKEIIRGLRISLRNIFFEIMWTAPLFILGLIPALSFFTTILMFLIQAYYAGFGNMDYTLERHLDVKESIRFVRKNRGLAIGLGTVFLLLLSTGIGFLVAPPLATAAATLSTSKRLHKKVR